MTDINLDEILADGFDLNAFFDDITAKNHWRKFDRSERNPIRAIAELIQDQGPLHLKTGNGVHMNTSGSVLEHQAIILNSSQTLDREAMLILLDTVIILDGVRYHFTDICAECNDTDNGFDSQRWMAYHFRPRSQ